MLDGPDVRLRAGFARGCRGVLIGSATRRPYLFDRPAGDRHLDDEAAPAPTRTGLVPEMAAVRGHDPERDGQAEARAVAGLLCGEERNEQPRLRRLRDAGPVVADGDPDPVAFVDVPSRPAGHRARFGLDQLGGDPQVGSATAFAAVDRLDRIDGEVEEDLLDLGAVEVDLGQGGRDVELDLDLVRADGVGLELEHALDQNRDARRPALGRSRAGEVEQVLDDAAGPVGLLDEQAGVALHVLGQARVAVDQLAEADDRRQRVVELVRDAGDEHADRLHLLGLEQLPLQPLLVGEVADQVEEAALAAELHDADLDLDGEFGAVRPAAAVAERAATLRPDDLAAAGHLAFVGGDELAEVAAEHLAAIDPVEPDRGLVDVQHGAVEG